MTQPAEKVGAGQVAEAARIVAGAGLAEGFGHVSARVSDSGFMITATRPLGACSSSDVHLIGPGGEPGAEDLPLETPMHAAIYGARADVMAICRTHSPVAVIAGTRSCVPPLMHGLGGLAGEVRLSARTDLVTDAAAGEEIVADLAGADCLLIRGNGSIAVGSSLPEAVVRARYLEERCVVGWGADPESGLDVDELASRAGWFKKEQDRAWSWMRWKYAGDS